MTRALILSLVLALVHLGNLASARPTFQTYDPSTSFLRRAYPDVGPAAALERLRLNKAKRDRPVVARSTTRSVITNPKAVSAASTSQVKRSSERSVVANPKAVLSSSVRRNIQERSPRNVVSNPKSQPVISSTRRAVVNLLPRLLSRRGLKKADRRAPAEDVIPNPKYSGFSSSSSTSLSATRTTTATSSGARTATTTSARHNSTTTTARHNSTTTSARHSSTTTILPTSSKTASSSRVSASTKSTTSSSSAASSTSTGKKWPTGDFISSAYYPDWDSDILPPKDVDMSLFDLINFAFAVPDSDCSVAFEQDDSSILDELITKAHAGNTKVVVSIGGWTDSTYFSSCVSDQSSRQTLVSSIASLVEKYGFDGADIDWEYPGGGGESSNGASPEDTENFLTFLKALRSKLGSDAHISTCTTQQPFLGSDGSPVSDVSGFAKVIDSILVMNYDVWGASSTPGPNAPLSDACSGSLQPNANEESAISTWEAAGMPASKIIMGVPSYGYVSSSSATTLIHRRSFDPATPLNPSPLSPRRYGGMSNRERAAVLHKESKRSPMHKWYLESRERHAKRKAAQAEEAAAVDVAKRSNKKRNKVLICPNDHSGLPCGGAAANQNITSISWKAVTGDSGSSNGVFGGRAGVGKLGDGDLSDVQGNQVQFNELISYGVIVASGSAFVGTNGYVRKWDTCSSTPYLYNTDRNVVITYDDPQSLALKGKMAASKKIGGIGMWDISGDTESWQLVKSFRKGLGLSSSS